MTLTGRNTGYLVRFPSVGKGLPHGDTETPHVTFTGEFVEVYTFWGVPLQWPFTCSTSLYNTKCMTTNSKSMIHQRQPTFMMIIRNNTLFLKEKSSAPWSTLKG